MARRAHEVRRRAQFTGLGLHAAVSGRFATTRAIDLSNPAGTMLPVAALTSHAAFIDARYYFAR